MPASSTTAHDFNAYLKLCVQRNESFLQHYVKTIALQTNDDPPPALFFKAMEYSLFNGGKRLRPLLVYATGEVLETSLDRLHAPAAAVELIHCFSLIHDDLPAMDNDDFRRGKPTCHKAFGEANAILVGDALQSLSFELLSNSDFNPNPLQQQMKMIQILSRASGMHGMVGGQALDIAEEQTLAKTLHQVTKVKSLNTLITLHRKKTGALISASVLLGLHAAGCDNQEIIIGLSQFSDTLGLAFQVQDDILDIEGNFETLGKTPGKDEKNEKLTFPKILGLEGAKDYKNTLYQQIMQTLKQLPLPPSKTVLLEQITHHFLERQY